MGKEKQTSLNKLNKLIIIHYNYIQTLRGKGAETGKFRPTWGGGGGGGEKKKEDYSQSMLLWGTVNVSQSGVE